MTIYARKIESEGTSRSIRGIERNIKPLVILASFSVKCQRQNSFV